MRVLLDTHVWLWMQAEPGRFSDGARDTITDLANELLFSAASSWEIAIKWSLGKLDLPEPPDRYVPDRLASSGVTALPILHGHALAVAHLTRHHRDPFDRLLVAQAQAEGLPLLTADPAFDRYPIEVISA